MTLYVAKFGVDEDENGPSQVWVTYTLPPTLQIDSYDLLPAAALREARDRSGPVLDLVTPRAAAMFLSESSK